MQLLRSLFTRRSLLHRLGLLGLGSFLPIESLFALRLDSSGDALQLPSASRSAIRNRAPLAPNAFHFLPLGSIRPTGWLKGQLEIQANGLSGHLDETWADVGPNSGWLGGTGESWERGPYFLDGLVPLAYLLDDPRLKAKAQRFVDWTLDHQAPSGMIGPASNDDWWPRILMLKALAQYQELSGDTRVIPVMEKYFRFQFGELSSTRPLNRWSKYRWEDELLTVVWLYNRTGSAFLLELANLLHDQGHDWKAQYANFQYTQEMTAALLKVGSGGPGILMEVSASTHGVNNAQAIKTGAVWSQVSGAEADRSAVMRMISELDKYHGLPNGMFSCDEHFSGRNPSQGSELCAVVEYMFSLEQALAITGNALLGDRLERLAFNALPGTFTDDMWAHQYNQEPNQVECSLHHKPWDSDGPESNLYGLEPNYGCCTANFHQGWPKFTNSLFMFAAAQGPNDLDGLVAAAYAPCEVRTVLNGTAIHIVEETDYPFRGAIRLTVNPASSMRFPLLFRVPGWATGSTIAINGEQAAEPAAGSFARIERTWNTGDRVEIDFPMTPTVSHWFLDSIAVERGPIVFSYGIGESWVKLRDRGMTADWQVFPTDAWNYALNVDLENPAKSFAVEEGKVGTSIFTRQNAPVELKVKARKLNDWLAEDGAANPPPLSPAASDQPDETITLIPYAAAKLRITAFPYLKS